MFHIPLNILPRKRWEALPPTSQEPLEVPVDYVFVTFTDSRECFTREDCSKLVKELQIQDMESGLPDIRFNFLLGGDGFIYEARGWNTNNFKTDPLYSETNGKTLDIAYMGPFPVPYQRNYPSLLVKLTKAKLLEFGIRNNFIYPSYNLSLAKDPKDLYAPRYSRS